MAEIIALITVIGIIFGLFYAVVLLVMPIVVWLIYDHIARLNRQTEKTNILLEEISGYFRNAVDSNKE